MEVRLEASGADVVGMAVLPADDGGFVTDLAMFGHLKPRVTLPVGVVIINGADLRL